MRVLVEGAITSIEYKEKDDRKFTELMLAQKGIKEQVQVRMEGNHIDDYELFQIEAFNGRLMTWKQREGIGSMVMVENA